MPTPTQPSAAQLEIINHVTGATPTDTLVIAGPGSGKTRTLVGSIAALVKKDPKLADRIVAISFTNNSAAELKVRLSRMAKDHDLPALHRVHVSTFHAWVGQLQARAVTPWQFAPILLKNASLSVALDLMARRSKAFDLKELGAADRHMEGSEDFATMWERDFNGVKKDSARAASFGELKNAVEQLEAKMEHIQIRTYGTLMKSGADLARLLPQGALEWLFIDEAQDMNAPQGYFVDAVQSATGCKLFVIADDDQGIYKFRGASTAYLEDFGKRPDTTSFPMEQNFRSTKQIVEACVAWVRPNWKGAAKNLISDRNGLPVIVLKNAKPDERAKHAEWILNAAKDCGLMEYEGEACILGNSPRNLDKDVQPLEGKIHVVRDMMLDPVIFQAWLHLLNRTTATAGWHHGLWEEFIAQVKVTHPDGSPGLNDLYAALEVARRLVPDETPAELAARLKKLDPAFLGERPDPDYEGDKWNYVSFHSSKGMEFPVVWVTSGAFTYAVSANEKQDGQPNLPGFGSNEDAKEMAIRAEKRRLLYVAMSRASDLLMISAPWSKHDGNERDFLGAVLTLPGVHQIYTDDDAKGFAATLRASHRNPTWERPKRYRVESYTSYTRQILPGVRREVEIPRKTECPMPHSEAAVVGDQFHRIMHLLCMQPQLLRAVRDGGNYKDLVGKVTVGAPPERLLELVEKVLTDETNKPYQLLLNGNCRSEVPFSVVREDPSEKPPAKYLVKGFIDVVRFNADGNPDLILDYKTGLRPGGPGDPKIDAEQAEQLRFYRDALATTYSVTPESITIQNYYVDDQLLVVR
jgi:superfamily I DNA/RNA helicase